MRWRRANPTGEAGTSVWCGRKLRRKYRTTWSNASDWNAPTRCSGCSGLYDHVDGEWEIEDSETGAFRCRRCGTAGQHGSGKRRVASREPVHDGAGEYGDGFFCGLRCACQFAVVLARAGHRVEVKSG